MNVEMILTNQEEIEELLGDPRLLAPLAPLLDFEIRVNGVVALRLEKARTATMTVEGLQGLREFLEMFPIVNELWRDCRIYGNGYLRRNENGAIERCDPSNVIITTRTP